MRASLIAVFLLGSCASAPPPLVVVSIDGLRPGTVLDDGNALHIPTLRSMRTRGTFASGVIGVLPTVTYPSHATIVTGCSPDAHGVLNNFFLAPERAPKRSWYWFAEDIRVDTLWRAARRDGRTTASVYWPSTSGADIDWLVPEIWGVGGDVHRRLFRALATAGLVRRFEADTGQPYTYDTDAALDVQNTRLVEYLTVKHRPALLLLHYTSLDHASHEHGPDSTEAGAALEALDRHLSRVQQAAGAGAVLAVVSDHGFVDVTSALHINVALKAAGFIDVGKGGRIQAWRAYAWSGAGVAAIQIANTEDEPAVLEVLEGLMADGHLTSIRERGHPERAGGFPDAAFVIVPRPGTTFVTAHTGDKIVKKSPVRGIHGRPAAEPEMHASFFLVGPGVPAGRDVGTIPMQDVGPTIAARVGLQLADATGRDRLR